MKKPLTIICLILLVLLAIWYYRHEMNYPDTEDAYLNANILQISAQVSGPVKSIYVSNNAFVKKGTLLFTIDPKPFRLKVDRAEAALTLAQQSVRSEQAKIKAQQAIVAERRAELLNAKQIASRILPLVASGRMAKAEGDKAKRQSSVAEAALTAALNQLKQVKQHLGKSDGRNANIIAAKTSLAQAQLALSYTKIYAPEDGYLVEFKLRPGSLVTAQTPLFSFIESHTWWVDANFKETQLSRIKPKQKATIIIDMRPNHVYHGIVDSVSRGSGSAFSLLPAENASGNWVKVTQRFSVKIKIDPMPKDNTALRVGASCQVTIDTRSN